MKNIALTEAMYTAICSYDEQAFDDINEESGKKPKHFDHFIINKPLWPVPIQGIVEQAEQNGELRPQQGRVRCPRMRLIKVIIK